MIPEKGQVLGSSSLKASGFRFQNVGVGNGQALEQEAVVLPHPLSQKAGLASAVLLKLLDGAKEEQVWW